MNYYSFEVGNNIYKLRLNTRAIIALEKKLGCNPIGIFDVNGISLPSVTQMVEVLHASAQQLEHGINIDKAYDIFDAYIADGHSMNDFVYVILEIYRESGLIPKEVETEKN